MTCDEAQAELLLARQTAPGGEVAAHLASCGACQAQGARLQALARVLAGYAVADPAPAAPSRTIAAAAPLRARRATEARGLRRRVAWALALTLLPLPLIIFANVKALMAAHALLLTVLPPSASLYLIVCLGAGVALLLALSYAAVPLLASRRPRLLALEDGDDVRVPA